MVNKVIDYLQKRIIELKVEGRQENKIKALNGFLDKINRDKNKIVSLPIRKQ